MTASSRIKGVAFRELIGWEATKHGSERVQRVAAGLPEDFQRTFESGRDYLGVVPSAWYPAPVVHALLDALTDGMSVAERDGWAHEGARRVMDATLGDVDKNLISKFVTPQLYARFAARVWESYYDSGDFEVVIVDPTTADCTISNWPAHHDVICAMNQAAATAIYEVIGMREVRTERTECVSHGGARCRFITTWAP